MGLFDWIRSGLEERPKQSAAPQPMSSHDIVERVRSLGDACPTDVDQIEGICWDGSRGVRLEKLTAREAAPPHLRIWIFEVRGDDVRLTTRPAIEGELVELVAVLREVGASDEEVATPAFEAELDCQAHRFQLSFVDLTQMIEGAPYKRWSVQYHRDGRPPSVAFLLETRREGWYHSLPGGAVLRGTPWEP